MSRIGVGRVRHALGDGVTEEQANRVFRLLRDAGLLSDTRVEIVGLAEIATAAGVSKAAVCQWSDLPDPLVRLKCGPIWLRADVDRYLADRGTAPKAGGERGE
jgi:hypothetical protein